MIRPTAAAVVYLCVAPTDLRKQAASLALLVEQSLKRDIFAPALYVGLVYLRASTGRCEARQRHIVPP